MKNRNVLFKIIIMAYLIAILMPIKTKAAGSYDKPGESGMNFGEAVSCHTFANADGGTDIVYCINTDGKLKLNIDNYTKDGKRKKHKKVSIPGTVWGGAVYAADDGNYYIATGSTGMGEAVYYIQKYDKDWSILGTATVYPNKGDMVRPFSAGNCDMVWRDNMLIVHTCMEGFVRELFVGEDGIHQYNYTFVVNTTTMDTIMTYPDMTVDSLHVSHSFTQFVRCDGKNIITVDHGDGYPRAVCLHLISLDDLDAYDGYMSLLDIKGKVGYNCTGVTVDGFELGKNHHIVVGTSLPHESFTSNEDFNKYDELYGLRGNIYVSLIDKNFQSSSIKWLTDFSAEEHKSITTLECIPLENDRFILLYGVGDWNEEGDEKETDDITCYQIIDSNGNILQTGSIKASFYCTSEPSYHDGVITWCHYVDNKLGTFMVKSDWNIDTGKFSTLNLKLESNSKISNVIAIDDSSFWKPLKKPLDCSIGDKITVTFAIVSNVFEEDGILTAPVIWTTSNSKVAQVLKQETILGGSTYQSTTIDNYTPYKEISTDIYIKSPGTAKITCVVGDKKGFVKIKVSAEKSSFRKKVVKMVSLKFKKKGEVIVKWKKVSGAEGYEVQYSEYKDIENSNRSSFGTDSPNQTSMKLSMYSKRRKICYVRVRAYKKIEGEIVYSKWSEKKEVKVK